MQISVATANYYMLPFEHTLEIIAQAGFQNIELDLFWEHKTWAMAQHLRGFAPRDVVRLIDRAGLKVASIHDGGGVLEAPDSIHGYINPQLMEYLDQLGYAPDCLVFHTPHIEGTMEPDWWPSFSPKVIAALEPFRAVCRAVTVENMPHLDGYHVPLITPEELLAFTCQAGVGINLDTTHYAYMNVDITQAARQLYGNVQTVHLSDFLAGKLHVFIGEGELNFRDFFRAIDFSALRLITLECSPIYPGETMDQMDTTALAQRLQTARARMQAWLQN